jgi:hypothetical protein
MTGLLRFGGMGLGVVVGVSTPTTMPLEGSRMGSCLLGGGDWAVHTASRMGRTRMESLMSGHIVTEGLKYPVTVCGPSTTELGVVLLYLSRPVIPVHTLR